MPLLLLCKTPIVLRPWLSAVLMVMLGHVPFVLITHLGLTQEGLLLCG